MKAEAAAKAGAAESKTPAERSPHAKEVLDLIRWLSCRSFCDGVAGSRQYRTAACSTAANACHRNRPPSPPPAFKTACLQSYDAAEFDTLVEKYETLNWRIIRCKFRAGQGRAWVLAVAAAEPAPVPARLPACCIRHQPLPPHRNMPVCSKPGGATVKPDDFYVLYG